MTTEETIKLLTDELNSKSSFHRVYAKSWVNAGKDKEAIRHALIDEMLSECFVCLSSNGFDTIYCLTSKEFHNSVIVPMESIIVDKVHAVILETEIAA